MSVIESLQSALGAAVTLREAGPNDNLDGLSPAAVAAPHDSAASLELIKLCAAKQWSVIPRGGGTQWQTGAKPRAFDVLLSTEHLTEIFDHDEGNATITAGAGCSLRRLNEVVGSSRQFLPFDAAPETTLGGIAATNFSNAWRARFGTARDLITGLDVLLSDGRELKTGAKVVKNVSGYDLPKLFIGSRGSLGLITKVTVRLRPMDEASQMWSHRYDSWEDLETALRHIQTGPFAPTVTRVVLRPATKSLYLRFDGPAQAVAAQLAELPADEEHSYHAELPVAPFLVKIAAPLALCQGIARFAHGEGAEEVIWDVASGVLRVANRSSTDQSLLTQLRQKAEAVGGYAGLERGPAEWKTPETVWGKPPAGLDLMRKVKQSYDAAGIFSPGRNTGGL